MPCSQSDSPRRWADLCLEEGDGGSIGEQEQQEIVPHAIVCVDEAVANPLSVLGNDIHLKSELSCRRNDD